MATTLITVDCKLFQMMPYIIILKVRKFHQTTANRFSTARKKPVGGGGGGLNLLLVHVRRSSVERTNKNEIKCFEFGSITRALKTSLENNYNWKNFNISIYRRENTRIVSKYVTVSSNTQTVCKIFL